MRKFLVLFCISIYLLGCSSNDNDYSDNQELNGTTWSEFTFSLNVDGDTSFVTRSYIKFTSINSFDAWGHEVDYKGNKPNISTLYSYNSNGSFVYDKPKLKFTVKELDGSLVVLNTVIYDNKFRLVYDENDPDNSKVYTKE